MRYGIQEFQLTVMCRMYALTFAHGYAERSAEVNPKAQKKNIWLRFAPLTTKARIAVKGFGLNRRDKCIKGNAVTWKRERATMPPPLFLIAAPPHASWRLRRAGHSKLFYKI